MTLHNQKVGPVLANIFMGHLETKALQDFPGRGPTFYKRFVDDTMMVFECAADVEDFFTWMNNQHPSISFTKECESNDSLPFLDVLIRRGQKCLETSVYRKPTYSGLYMQWDSYLPKAYKRGLVIGLVNRAWRICSSFAGFHQELFFLQGVIAV